MEDAAVIELLDELRADAMQLGEIVRRAARGGEQLEGLERDIDLDGRLGDDLLGRPQIGVTRPSAGSAVGCSMAPISTPERPWLREMPSMAARAMRSQ